jgi:hypothetical protein
VVSQINSRHSPPPSRLAFKILPGLRLNDSSGLRLRRRSTQARQFRWIGILDDGYRNPLAVRDDEVPADLLARLAEKSPQSPHTAAKA